MTPPPRATTPTAAASATTTTTSAPARTRSSCTAAARGCTAWSDFGPVAPLFAADRRCLLVDIHQYGKSEKSRISGPMWDHHAAKTVALMDTLGVERADFVCNSWGGTIALNLAAKYPDRVRSLVVTGSMPVFYGPLAPLPEGGRRGRNARDVYYGGEGPTREKMRALITRLEWYDADALPEETLDLRYRQSLDPASASSPRCRTRRAATGRT